VITVQAIHGIFLELLELFLAKGQSRAFQMQTADIITFIVIMKRNWNGRDILIRRRI
jgi:hypothetical protein